MASPAKPSQGSARLTNLDLLRGVAVLGILLMNVVSWSLGTASYFNITVDGTGDGINGVIAIFGEVFADQKFMGIFSLLFGASAVLFAERAEAKGARPVRLSLWRNFLLLLIGVAHSMLWEGDILIVYAVCSPVVILMRGFSPKLLLAVGVTLILSIPLLAAWAQGIPHGPATLGEYWYADGVKLEESSPPIIVFLIADFFLRSLGMMALGVALYRLDFMKGTLDPKLYRRAAQIGTPIGLTLAAAGVAFLYANDFGPDVSIVATIPNTIGTIPAVLGYVGVIALWNLRADTGLKERLRAVGRMALTNYLSHTVMGVIFFSLIVPEPQPRTVQIAFVLTVWGAQLWWSKAWLERFKYGPLEWLWRCGTYTTWLPIRRDAL